MTLIGLLVVLVLICLVFWAITTIMSAFGVGDPIRSVVLVIFVVIVVLYLVSASGINTGIRIT